MSSERIKKIKLHTIKLQSKIKWRNNANCADLSEMVRAAKLNLDCGLDKTMELMPLTCFHQWVHFAFVITKLYNRDRPDDAPQLLCMIRMAYTNVYYLFINSDHTVFPV